MEYFCRLNNEETWWIQHECQANVCIPLFSEEIKSWLRRNPKHHGAMVMEEKLDMSSCDFQKHGNKMPSLGGKQRKLWLTNQMAVAVELKYTDLQSRLKMQACQDAFFIIVLPSTGLFSCLPLPFPSPSLPPPHPTSSTLPYPLKEYCTH